MAIKLILIDLDDTLLRADHTISPANEAALRAARSRGSRVALASGRMFASMRPYAEQLGLSLPLICYNGALGRPLDGPPLWHQPVPNAPARRILTRLAALSIHVNIYLDDRLFVAEATEQAQAYTREIGVPFTAVGDLVAFLGDRAPTKILGISTPELTLQARTELEAELTDQAEITTSHPHFLECTAPGVSKAVGLRHLIGSLEISRSEVMAIGNALNDLEMLLAAGIGVAVGNAEPEVLDGVRWAVAPCEEDGVAEAIERFVLKSGINV